MSMNASDFFQRARLQALLDEISREVRLAEAELSERMGEILAFEAQVEERLGDQLDELNCLESEIERYMDFIDRLRRGVDVGSERRTVPGSVPPSYYEDEIVPVREDKEEGTSTRLRSLYRKLVRRYHPDLAMGEADWAQRTKWMLILNRAYAEEDLATLEALDADMLSVEAEFGAGNQQKPWKTDQDIEEKLVLARKRLDEVRWELENLHRHPSVQLSLDVKLAEREGRDLLAEISMKLAENIERKRTERDFLRYQLAQAGIKV